MPHPKKEMQYITPLQGARIQRERINQGKTREQFAVEFRVHARTVESLERGAKRIRWDIAERFGRFIGGRA